MSVQIRDQDHGGIAGAVAGGLGEPFDSAGVRYWLISHGSPSLHLICAMSGNDGVKIESYALKQRRASSKEEYHEQQKLAGMLPQYLDPSRTFWTALENKPRSAISGMFQKRRGVRSGIPDLLVIFRKRSGRLLVVFVELKSRRGIPTPNWAQIRCELLPVGVQWCMARSADAALMALHLAGVEFRRQWKPPRLKPWEGPLKDPNERLPMAPDVIAERHAARRVAGAAEGCTDHWGSG